MTQRYFLPLLGVAMLSLLGSCAKPANTPEVDCTGKHFCMGSFLQGQMAGFEKDKPTVSKYVYLNGKEETQQLQLDMARWQAELTAFREADIDKPAMVGKYKIDTLFVTTDSLTQVSYWAQDDDLRTRYLHVYYKPNSTQPAYIEARLETDNLFYQSRQDIAFSPGEFYAISGFQDIWLLGEDTFAVKSVFVQP